MIIVNNIIDDQIELKNKERGKYSRPLGRFWPTEASCNVCNKITGKCLRELYYSATGAESSNPISARGLRICDSGNMYEDKEIERVKSVSYYKDSGSKIEFQIPKTLITVAGKLDIVYNINNKIIGGEVKSGYGYMFQQQIFNSTTTPGLPIIKHLMQVMMYLYYFKYIDKSFGIDEFYMTYIDRGNCDNAQFGIKLTEDDYPIIENEAGIIYVMRNIIKTNALLFDQNPKGKREQNKVNKSYNKLKYYEISIDNIFNRFKTVYEYIIKKELPPKDYKYIYTVEDIEKFHNDGDISDAKYEKMKKSKVIERDFQCTYCNYLKNCITDDKGYSFKNEVS